jgi:hypothetical protein
MKGYDMPGKDVESASSAEPATVQSRLPKVTVAGRPVELPVVESDVEEGEVDICFVFDTTGSMSNKINGLVNCMVEFVGELARLRLDWRVTAVPFGDLTVPGDRVVEDLKFVSTRDAAQDLLRKLPRFNGGANEGESSLEAVMAACRKDYRSQAVKVLVVLTDEPPLKSSQLTAAHVGDMIAQEEFICFVAAPDPRTQGSRVEGFRSWARDNGGEWYPINQTMPTDELLAFLKSLVKAIPKVAKKAIEAGSVRRYLELEGPNNDSR